MEQYDSQCELLSKILDYQLKQNADDYILQRDNCDSLSVVMGQIKQTKNLDMFPFKA